MENKTIYLFKDEFFSGPGFNQRYDCYYYMLNKDSKFGYSLMKHINGLPDEVGVIPQNALKNKKDFLDDFRISHPDNPVVVLDFYFPEQNKRYGPNDFEAIVEETLNKYNEGKITAVESFISYYEEEFQQREALLNSLTESKEELFVFKDVKIDRRGGFLDDPDVYYDYDCHYYILNPFMDKGYDTVGRIHGQLDNKGDIIARVKKEDQMVLKAVRANFPHNKVTVLTVDKEISVDKYVDRLKKTLENYKEETAHLNKEAENYKNKGETSMSTYKLTANFYPSNEPKNGYIGKADLTIADAIRINGISVFQKDGNYNIDFPGYDFVIEDQEKHNSYVLPSSKEAYAAMLEVVKMAVEDQKHHFGHTNGKFNPELSVTGKKVDELYAEGRYSLAVKDLCVLTGITSVTRDGEKGKFVAVDMPTIGSYEKDGEVKYNAAFEGLTSKYEKDGKPMSKNFGTLIRNMIFSEHKKLHEAEKSQEKPSFNDQVKNASETAKKFNADKSGQQKEKSKEDKEMDAPF